MIKKNYPFRRAKEKFFGAFGADPLPQNLKLEKNGFENFGGSGGGGGRRGGVGVWSSNRPPPLPVPLRPFPPRPAHMTSVSLSAPPHPPSNCPPPHPPRWGMGGEGTSPTSLNPPPPECFAVRLACVPPSPGWSGVWFKPDTSVHSSVADWVHVTVDSGAAVTYPATTFSPLLGECLTSLRYVTAGTACHKLSLCSSSDVDSENDMEQLSCDSLWDTCRACASVPCVPVSGGW